MQARCGWENYNCVRKPFGASDYCLRHHVIRHGDIVFSDADEEFLRLLIKATNNVTAVFRLYHFVKVRDGLCIPTMANAMVFHTGFKEYIVTMTDFADLLRCSDYLATFNYNLYSVKSALAELLREIYSEDLIRKAVELYNDP